MKISIYFWLNRIIVLLVSIKFSASSSSQRAGWSAQLPKTFFHLMCSNTRNFSLCLTFKIGESFERYFWKLNFGRCWFRGRHQTCLRKIVSCRPWLIIFLVTPFFTQSFVWYFKSHTTRSIFLNDTVVWCISHWSRLCLPSELSIAEVIDSFSGSILKNF